MRANGSAQTANTTDSPTPDTGGDLRKQPQPSPDPTGQHGPGSPLNLRLRVLLGRRQAQLATHDPERGLLTCVWSRPSPLELSSVSPLVDLVAVRTRSARRPYSTVSGHRQHAMVIAWVFQQCQGFLAARALLARPSAQRLSRSGGGGAGSNPAGGTLSSLKTSKTS